MVSVQNLHWGNFLINGVYRWRDEYGHETCVGLLTWNVKHHTTYKV